VRRNLAIHEDRSTGTSIAPGARHQDSVERGGCDVPFATVHQVWQHEKTNEIWAVRLDRDVLTGVFGPIACTPSAAVLPALPYEEHPDDLEWVIRSAEDFRIV